MRSMRARAGRAARGEAHAAGSDPTPFPKDTTRVFARVAARGTGFFFIFSG